MSSECLVTDRIGADNVNVTFWPRWSAGETVTNSIAASYWSVSPSRLVRRPIEAGTGAACSRRSITSRTGRSPMLVTVPVTVTTGSLVVVTTCGVTWSMRTWTNGVAPGSPAAAVGSMPTLRPVRMPTTASKRDRTPRRSRGAVEPRLIPASGCCPHLELLCIVVGG